jgi:hypothetical protein
MHTCYSAMSYMFIDFAGYLMDLKISCGARKLTRTFRVIKKKYIINNLVGLEDQIVRTDYNNKAW